MFDRLPKPVEKQFFVVCCYTDKVYALVSDNALHAVQRCAREVCGHVYVRNEQTIWGEYGVTVGDFYCFFDGRYPRED